MRPAQDRPLGALSGPMPGLARGSTSYFARLGWNARFGAIWGVSWLVMRRARGVPYRPRADPQRSGPRVGRTNGRFRAGGALGVGRGLGRRARAHLEKGLQGPISTEHGARRAAKACGRGPGGVAVWAGVWGGQGEARAGRTISQAPFFSTRLGFCLG